MACHVTKINYNDKQSSKEKLIILANMNLKAFETVDCTCTILSISDESRFTCAQIWSVCFITSSLFVAFVRVCFAIINICRKIRNKKKLIKYWLKTLAFRFLTESHRSSQKPQFHCSFLFLNGSLVRHFNYAIISEFSLQLRYCAINIQMNCSDVNQITCAILSISSISRLTIAYMWSNGVCAVCILMTGVVSLTLINVYEITDEKKNGISKLYKNYCAYAITLLKSASHGCFQSFAGLREREKTGYLCKKPSLKNF